MAKRQTNSMKMKARAVCVAYSWLESFGVPVRVPHSAAEGDLVVAGLRVAVAAKEVDGCDVTLDIDALLGQSVAATLAEVHKLTERAGYGRPAGTRNASGLARAKSSDYEATSMRLSAFARTSNIPAHVLKRWEPIAKREAWRAYRRWTVLGDAMMMEYGDYVTYALVFTNNFLHRNRTNLNDDKDTAALLTENITQEFKRWATVTARKVPNITPNLIGVCVEQVVSSPVQNASFEDASYEEDVGYTFDIEAPDEKVELEPVHRTKADEEKWEKSQAMKQGRYLAQRRRNATQALEDGLASLGHERFVEALSNIIRAGSYALKLNPFDPEAQEEAERRMAEHLKSCEACRCADEAWSEVLGKKASKRNLLRNIAPSRVVAEEQQAV